MLFTHVYSAPGGAMLADLTGRVSSLEIATNKFGIAYIRCNTDLALPEAFRLYDRAGVPHVVVADSAGLVCEARMEDPRITGGFNLVAFGYWRAYTDPLYTALWSKSGVADWRAITAQDLAGRKPELYFTDTNNRIFIGLTKNTTYANNTDVGGFVLDIPHNSVRDFNYLTFNYDYNVPVNWVVRAVARDSAWGSAQVNNITVVGGAAAGTLTWDLSATPRAKVTIEIFNNTGGAYNYVGETGASYLRVTGLRATSTGASCTANEVAAALVAYTAALNPGQAATTTQLIEAPGLELYDEEYKDARPAAILDYLASLGDSTTPPRQWEVGVWENRMLHFRPRGSVSRTWYVDIEQPQLERTLDALANSTYAVYQLEDGRVQRTAAATDTDSIALAGLTRQAVISASTTSATQAGVQRDALLADRKDPTPRVEFDFDQVYDAVGAPYPLYLVRSGDSIVARNLPPSISTTLDRVRSGRIAETVYNAARGKLRVVMESPIPGLDTLLAQVNAGVGRVLYQAPRPGSGR